jgi:hypothetical protein
MEDNESAAGSTKIDAGLEDEVEDFGTRNETVDGHTFIYIEDPR